VRDVALGCGPSLARALDVGALTGDVEDLSAVGDPAAVLLEGGFTPAARVAP
jgi:hypothetical protein